MNTNLQKIDSPISRRVQSVVFTEEGGVHVNYVIGFFDDQPEVIVATPGSPITMSNVEPPRVIASQSYYLAHYELDECLNPPIEKDEGTDVRTIIMSRIQSFLVNKGELRT